MNRTAASGGDPQEAIDAPQQLVHLQHADAATHRRLAGALITAGRWDEAVVSLLDSLRLEPDNVRAHANLGEALMRLGRSAEALQCFERAVKLDPHYAIGHNGLGSALYVRGEFAAALTSHLRALELKPDFVEAHHNCGNDWMKLREPLRAQRHYEHALHLRPNAIDTLIAHGDALLQQGRTDEALQSYRRVLERAANHARALCNAAATLLMLQQPEEALQLSERAICANPALAEAHNNRAGALRALRSLDEAQTACEQALKLKPELAEAWSNLGRLMLSSGRLDEAIQCCERAIRSSPKLLEAHELRAWALLLNKRPDQALRGYEQLFELHPERNYLPGAILSAKRAACDWSEVDSRSTTLTNAVLAGQAVVEPFVYLSLSDSPAAQQRCAQRFVAEQGWPRPDWTRSVATGESQRIKVAYLSADFHDHATAVLASGLFEAHDRRRFETYALSFGREDTGPVRARLTRAFDHFMDVRQIDDARLAQWMRDAGIDIAVDLKGFTQESRPGVFARRAAPIQVNYLGYPGTLGLEQMDYILADRVVLPPEDRCHYTEQVVYLPECYQVNDDRRETPQGTPTRIEVGLPREGFVFCCFNNNYKIAPELFDVWMRLLHEVVGSTLWLLRDNDVAAANLRQEAARRGVEPDRLVFAERLPTAQHVARHANADLFLDTLPYNAHTTCSDALWAGLPVLTCLGRSFAGRVAASLLNAIGLPELITRDLAHYEQRALELAHDGSQLSGLRARLERNRGTHPLFDTKRRTRHIEAAYALMWERWQRGLPPASIDVPALD
jgi:predicted O-linked N-acetylglucosamine transferase (SPINDLY family)